MDATGRESAVEAAILWLFSRIVWACGGYEQRLWFIYLGAYDMILGAGWLEQHSPMWVHWKNKIMKFEHKGELIIIHGVSDNVS